MSAKRVSSPSFEVNPPDLHNPALYLNRELSHLGFQRRVFEEARDPRNPLLERVKFLSILGSNMDEFFMVRVAGLMQQIESGVHDPGIDGRSPAETLDAIRAEAGRLMTEAYDFLRAGLLPALAEADIRLVDLSAVDAEQRAHLDAIFHDQVFPVLTPLAFDPGRPFPHISNLSLNVAAVVREPGGQEHFARIKLPDSLPQFLPVSLKGESPAQLRTHGLVPIEELVIANLQHLFPGLETVQAHLFHVTRDAEVAIKELESDDLLETIEEAVWRRRFTHAVRLQVDLSMPASMLEILANNLEVGAASIYRVDGLLDLSRLRHLTSLDRPDLKDKPFTPFTPPGLGPKDDEIFELIRQEDQLLHHPYDSFQPVIEFLRKAASDPDVLAIKMTLYRIGRNSPIVEALLEAVENGKQVAVLVELKARFD
jgi:polyphosphate kinase